MDRFSAGDDIEWGDTLWGYDDGIVVLTWQTGHMLIASGDEFHVAYQGLNGGKSSWVFVDDRREFDGYQAAYDFANAEAEDFMLAKRQAAQGGSYVLGSD